ncbi:sigma-54 dependent transcriptional regulator [bacterium]|nr:sigma-54 dependent transcriptional regulator [bacterium]
MKVDKNEFFRQSTMKICGNLDLGIALQEFLQYLNQFMPADYILLNVFEKGLSVLKTVYLVTRDNIRTNPYYSRISTEATRYIETREMPHARIIHQPGEDPVTKDQVIVGSEPDWLVMQRQDYSVIVMYLGIQGIKVGNVSIGTYKKGRYIDEYLDLITILNEPFTIAYSNALRYYEVVRLKNMLSDDVQYLKRELKERTGDDVIGGDFGLREVMDQVKEVAPMDSPVLLLGDTGVGKEVIANAVHTLSRRRKGPFIRVNCGAIPESLMDSELFGHEKGAFTGAMTRKRGCFERADRGTIFLDEVAELSATAQIRMLRVLQEREIIRVGGSEYVPVDIRIIAATNNNLQDMVKKGLFRSDLWFRLHVFPIYIPPLRDRKEDIPALVSHFIEKKSFLLRLPKVPELAPGALERLQAYSWPGNVRELENVVERALILSRNRPLTFSEITWTRENEHAGPLPANPESFLKLDSVIYRHLTEALSLSGGKINGSGGAAELLGVNPNTLRHRMKKLGIDFGRNSQPGYDRRER